jgi:zeta-carotene desaturase
VTPVPNLFLCGDWTATGWPATMESAVRSGRLAAEGVLAAAGRRDGSEPLVTPDLPRGPLARWVIR